MYPNTNYQIILMNACEFILSHGIKRGETILKQTLDTIKIKIPKSQDVIVHKLDK